MVATGCTRSSGISGKRRACLPPQPSTVASDRGRFAKHPRSSKSCSGVFAPSASNWSGKPKELGTVNSELRTENSATAELWNPGTLEPSTPGITKPLTIDVCSWRRECAHEGAGMVIQSYSRWGRRVVVLVGLLLLAGCSRAAQPQYDLVIVSGSVLDGTGAPPVVTDVGVREGRIAAIGDLKSAAATRRIDAAGLTVTPGFIDMHNHSDYTILIEPKAESMIRQGVTTMVLGES